eukprot:gb/GFBE01036751.1/.p1 GENE.gb/GFBE01036751.1/~~gb/GFBE01036751.1/.p1  ORF type:complete len:687 (+),score=258.62 gb/GFBE01036751.1/:1-2061(+)
MKMRRAMRLAAALLLTGCEAAVVAGSTDHEADASRPITRVVKLLEDMSVKAKADAEAEDETFKKFQCYCDKTLDQKTTEIGNLEELVAATQNGIDKLVALQSELQSKESQLEADISAKKDSQSQAVTTRNQTREAFLKEEGEMNNTITGLETAINQLSAAETAPATTDAALLALTNQLKQASASKGFLAPKASAALLSIQQEPSASSVTGVLKNTRDTYISDRKDLQKAEVDGKSAAEKMMATMASEEAGLKVQLSRAQEALSNTISELSTKRDMLDDAKKDLESSKALKETTERSCQEKKKVIEKKKVLRAQEDAAIAKAISVLNSDSAFATFGSAQSTGKSQALAQFGVKVQRHDNRKLASGDHEKVFQLLQKLAHEGHSSRLARVAAFASDNPMDKVLSEISTMKTRIAEEAAADKKQFDWCAKEKTANEQSLQSKSEQVVSLQTSMTELENSIDNPLDGLQVTLDTSQRNLEENQADQAKATEMRKADNADYQKNVANLNEAINLIAQGTNVLKKYYDSIKKELALVQEEPTKVQDSDAPDVDTSAFSGQSEAGAQVLSLLATIQQDTEAEETEAHSAESSAQASYEESMAALVKEEDTLKTTVADTKKAMADTRLELSSKKSQLASAEQEHATVGDYLKDIESSCKFINTNFETREGARTTELAGLERAEGLLGNTPEAQP